MADKQLNLNNIDEESSANNVTSFFTRTGKSQLSKFDKLVMYSGSSTDDLKSSIWSDMPKGGNSFNSAEDKAIKRIDRSAELEVMVEAIQHIDKTFKKIFVRYYVSNNFHGMMWTDICQILGYERTQANLMMWRAKVSFAYSYGYHEELSIKTFLVPNVPNIMRTNPVQFPYTLRTN
ncbi:ArpU family phage packaging/lysis transcriptional regulator [Oenococcus oeni]|uniref:ArpU family phage packaging/lysis transcriptional regulator n=2 Tax=Oenococcus oeni TaxID=1247 RepID=UPI0008F97777|nr:ArpU family phage packaging/lysis transcriptional regulator [Oenococcus oeni]OIL71233.1 hypothetical protein ATX33_09575 [Oenococcus oeni]OIM03290.1 hypothetical protein ATX50_09455 [Oenococcus oeni]PDH92870.1 hypothetical protein AO466_05840 [Oenococcus oeni]